MEAPVSGKPASVIAGKMLCKGHPKQSLGMNADAIARIQITQSHPDCQITSPPRYCICRKSSSELTALVQWQFAVRKLLLKITGWIAFLKTLGAWGVLVLATVDSIAIPIPLDALVAGYVYSIPHKAWLYCIAAAVGSALGSLVPYALGRAGGELFLLKKIDEARLQRIRDRFEKQEFLALMIPSILPPPTPFKLFVFSAGVFEMKVLTFCLAITCGRLIRFAIISVLTIIFGPQIVTEVRSLLTHHPWVILIFAVVLIVGGYLIFRLLRAPAVEVAAELRQHEPNPENKGNK
jgi:membrane protein YqaA with SNARE-associated domain